MKTKSARKTSWTTGSSHNVFNSKAALVVWFFGPSVLLLIGLAYAGWVFTGNLFLSLLVILLGQTVWLVGRRLLLSADGKLAKHDNWLTLGLRGLVAITASMGIALLLSLSYLNKETQHDLDSNRDADILAQQKVIKARIHSSEHTLSIMHQHYRDTLAGNFIPTDAPILEQRPNLAKLDRNIATLKVESSRVTSEMDEWQEQYQVLLSNDNKTAASSIQREQISWRKDEIVRLQRAVQVLVERRNSTKGSLDTTAQNTTLDRLKSDIDQLATSASQLRQQKNEIALRDGSRTSISKRFRALSNVLNSPEGAPIFMAFVGLTCLLSLLDILPLLSKWYSKPTSNKVKSAGSAAPIEHQEEPYLAVSSLLEKTPYSVPTPIIPQPVKLRNPALDNSTMALTPMDLADVPPGTEPTAPDENASGFGEMLISNKTE